MPSFKPAENKRIDKLLVGQLRRLRIEMDDKQLFNPYRLEAPYLAA